MSRGLLVGAAAAAGYYLASADAGPAAVLVAGTLFAALALLARWL